MEQKVEAKLTLEQFVAELSFAPVVPRVFHRFVQFYPPPPSKTRPTCANCYLIWVTGERNLKLVYIIHGESSVDTVGK